MKEKRKFNVLFTSPGLQWLAQLTSIKMIIGGVLFFLLVNILIVGAQTPSPDTIEIPLTSANVIMENGRFQTTTHPYAVIQLSRDLRYREHRDLQAQGVHLLSYLYNNAWLAAVEPDALSQELIDAYGLKAAVPWLPENKAPKSLQQGNIQGWALSPKGDIKLLITFFTDVTQQQIEDMLNRHVVTYNVFSLPYTWAVEIAPEDILGLLQEPIVHHVDEGPLPFMPLLDDTRQLINADSVQQINLGTIPPVYDGLSGSGVNIQVSENVYMDHEDFWNHNSAGNKTSSRFINYSPDAGSWSIYTWHGTLVAGIIGGNGWDSADHGGSAYQWRGVSPEATLYSGSDYQGVNNIHASNHSYVMECGVYGGSAASIDSKIVGESGENFQWPQIWAAANQGLNAQWCDGNGQGEEGYYSMYAPAKNAIAVGSVNANDGVLSHFSSMGPTFDGRIKPDVVAPGGKYLIPRNMLTVTIDWIRILNTDTGVYDKRWEFNTDGDLEGWFQTQDHQLINGQVANGYLTFNSWGEGYGHNTTLNLAASEEHVIQMRYKMSSQDVDDPTESTAKFFWHTTGDPNCSYVSGYTNFEVNIDDQFETVTVPVGTDWFDYCSGAPSGWSGDIDMLRIDPVRSVDQVTSTAKHQDDGTFGYDEEKGTSFAAPATTGVVGLMLQQFVETHGINLDVNPPLPSTIKAILIQTATDLTHETADLRDPNNPDTNTPVLYYEGPDFATGYGLVNAQTAVDFIAAAAANTSANILHEAELDTYTTHIYEMEVVAGDNIKVTLAWDDPAADTSLPQAANHLVNDLDIIVIDPNGNWHYPWTLNPLPVASCSGHGPGCGDPDPITPSDVVPAHRNADRLNNVEMVQVDNVGVDEGGKWFVLVLGWDINAPLQSYSLASDHHMMPIAAEVENNNNSGEAMFVPANLNRLAGSINPAGDVDYYAFFGKKGATVTLDIDAFTMHAYLDAVLHLYDTDGVTELAMSDDHDLFDPYIEYTLPAHGIYYLKVRHYDETTGGGFGHFYQLIVEGHTEEQYDLFLPVIMKQ